MPFRTQEPVRFTTGFPAASRDSLVRRMAGR